MKAIEVKDLSFAYQNATRYAIRHVDLDVEEGDFVVIAGPSGCGKSTLIRALNGLIPHFYEGKYEGSVILEGVEVASKQPHELFKLVGTVFQEPESQLLTFSVEREVAFPLENAGIPRDEMRRAVDEVIKRLNLEALRYRSPNELSGGEQQKVAIAAALVSKPKVLLLDEPTSNLDPVSANSLIWLLHELNLQGMTIVVSEHRLPLVVEFSNKLVVMDSGMIADVGRPVDVLGKYADKDIIEVPDVLVIADQLTRAGLYAGDLPLSVGQFLSSTKGLKPVI
ncbi:MAG: ABC transporter ATP-binding protein [Candidatus Marsarchaeota archaeon]